jgi:hypothetical protein
VIVTVASSAWTIHDCVSIYRYFINIPSGTVRPVARGTHGIVYQKIDQAGAGSESCPHPIFWMFSSPTSLRFLHILLLNDAPVPNPRIAAAPVPTRRHQCQIHYESRRLFNPQLGWVVQNMITNLALIGIKSTGLN